jgi:uncharacterized protein with PIN domain
MGDMREKYYDCPECKNQHLKEHSTLCPDCGADLRFCGEKSHFVDEGDYDEEVGMCTNCWQGKLDRE